MKIHKKCYCNKQNLVVVKDIQNVIIVTWNETTFFWFKVYLVVGKSGVKIPKSDDLVLFANEGVPIHSAGLNDLQHSIVVSKQT